MSGSRFGAVANALSVCVAEIHNDDDLTSLYTFFGQNVLGVATHLARPNVNAITLRLPHRNPVDRQFLSVIDCRGQKERAAPLTIWHELVHVMLMPPAPIGRRRLARHERHADEHLADAIAAYFAFDRYLPTASYLPRTLPDMLRLRDKVCPMVPLEMFLIGVARRLAGAVLFKAIPCPSAASPHEWQMSFWPEGHRLRIAQWSERGNRFARPLVPRSSVISRTEHGYGEAIEDVTWTTSRRRKLMSARVLAAATKSGVVGAIVPID